MSAAMVCGKRSYSEEEECESSPVVTKKLRCSCPTVTASLVDRLIELYPNIHKQLLEKALQENDNDVDSVIRTFNRLRLGHVDGNSDSANAATSEECVGNYSQQEIEALVRENAALKEHNRILSSKEKETMVLKEQNEALMRELVASKEQNEALVRESVASKEQNEARVRENVTLKEQNTILKRGVRNTVALKELISILKRGVVSKHESQKELKKDYDNKTQELEHLKKKVSTLEMKLYALTRKQAQEVHKPMPGRRHRDVF